MTTLVVDGCSFTFPASTAVAAKCRDTLAGLMAARVRASGDEQALARLAVRAQSLRIVLHAELPGPRKKIFERQGQLANLQKKLRIAVRSMDPSPRVHDRSTPFPGWSTR